MKQSAENITQEVSAEIVLACSHSEGRIMQLRTALSYITPPATEPPKEPAVTPLAKAINELRPPAAVQLARRAVAAAQADRDEAAAALTGLIAQKSRNPVAVPDADVHAASATLEACETVVRQARAARIKATEQWAPTVRQTLRPYRDEAFERLHAACSEIAAVVADLRAIDLAFQRQGLEPDRSGWAIEAILLADNASGILARRP